MRHYRTVPGLLFSILGWFALAACGASQVSEPTATLSSEAAAGRQVFQRDCGSCHSLVEDVIIVGPSLYGIADRAGNRIDGVEAKAYLLNSILRPCDFVVKGFECTMPENFGKKLTGEEIDGVVSYLLSVQ